MPKARTKKGGAKAAWGTLRFPPDVDIQARVQGLVDAMQERHDPATGKLTDWRAVVRAIDVATEYFRGQAAYEAERAEEQRQLDAALAMKGGAA